MMEDGQGYRDAYQDKSKDIRQIRKGIQARVFNSALKLKWRSSSDAGGASGYKNVKSTMFKD